MHAYQCQYRMNIFFSSYTVRGARPGKNVQLTEAEIRGLCLKSREIFLSQPILLELEAPLKICGKYLLFHHLLYICSIIPHLMSCYYGTKSMYIFPINRVEWGIFNIPSSV